MTVCLVRLEIGQNPFHSGLETFLYSMYMTFYMDPDFNEFMELYYALLCSSNTCISFPELLELIKPVLRSL
jgi:hypothetical protein